METFRVGEVLVYDVYGLCRVKEIKKITFDKNGPAKDYYVLEPLAKVSSLYYLPVENERAASKLRRPFSKRELDKILSQVKEENYQWIENRQLRSDAFRSVLYRGITPELVSLVKCIYCRKKELLQKGKRLSTTDENIFSLAEKLLNEEFAFALGIKEDEVGSYISSYFDGK